MIDFIIEHDEAIIEKLNRPIFLGAKRYLYLGNNALEQLGVISKDSSELTLLKLIDKTSTAFGKRVLRERLLSPIVDRDILERRYDLSEKIVKSSSKYETNLKNIYDLERILRRIKLHKLHPLELTYLASSLNSILNILKDSKEDNIDFDIKLMEGIEELKRYLYSRFELNICAKFRLEQIDNNIFKVGIYPTIDNILELQRRELSKIETVIEFINRLFEKKDIKGAKSNSFAEIGYLESEGFSVNLTKNRFLTIEKELKDSFVTIDDKHHFFKDFHFKRLKNSVKLNSQLFEEITQSYESSQIKLISLVKSRYIESLDDMDKRFSHLLEDIVAFVSNIDVAVSNAKCMRELNLTRPIIVDSGRGVEVVGLRHPIIEANERSGIYVPNDIYLGEKIETTHNHITLRAGGGDVVSGVLLYGINSSGKSSLMKSLGLAIILAQAGFFVPAVEMKFSLFDKIFTRIVSKDNLYKGLSTFSIEMLELKNIFNRATKNSLILGDEISQGTETLSGVAIVSGAILKLLDIGSLFIFATHLHQLKSIDELQKREELLFLHLGVKYDEENDRLIYNRELQVGMGSSLYGLEFAKSLHMDKIFLKNAYTIREKLLGSKSELKLLKSRRKSRYNKNLYITKCALCDEVVDDVHHILPQNRADENGKIYHIDKNHRYNLIPLCKKHHKLVHEGKITILGFVMTSDGLKLHYNEKD